MFRGSADIVCAMPTPDDPADVVDAPAIDAIERSLVGLRRSMSRRALGRVLVEGAGGAFDLRQLEVLDAVLIGPGEDGDGCTVGDVARRLALDPSQASRAVAGAVEAGLVRRVASQLDGRRTVLVLTEVGHEMAERMREARRQHARSRTAGWSSEELQRFGAALARFTSTDDPG